MTAKREVSKFYDISGFKLGGITLVRGERLWVSEKPYPMLKNWPGNPRGVFIIEAFPTILYAYEEVIQHEFTHALVFFADGLRERTMDAIVLDPGADSEVLKEVIEATTAETTIDTRHLFFNLFHGSVRKGLIHF